MNIPFLHRHPYVRLVVPWIAGVVCGDRSFGESTELCWIILFFCFFTACAFALSFLKVYSLRWCFGVAMFGFCFTGGWVGVTWQLKQTSFDFPKEETVYRVLLTSKPEVKERSYLCRVEVKELRDSLAIRPVNRHAILYIATDSAVGHWQSGEEYLVSSVISTPCNAGNFDEFDYARYLSYKGISGTGYVARDKWKRLSVAPSRSFRNRAASYRDRLISFYRELGFTGDELAVLSALTVGDKTELSESVRESYAISGASHVLALSGLHIALLCGLLAFCLEPMVKHWRGGKYVRTVLLLSLLWVFAFFTGFSPSVIRAACMCSVWAISQLFMRDSLSLNTLAATAFAMLLYSPAWVFDVGFQLSFLAVAGILLIQPPLYRLFSVENRAGKYVWGLMSVSIAAQIGTTPIVLFYFSRFSTHFLLTNLLVIPLITTVLYAAVFMLLLTPFLWLQEGMAWVVSLLLRVTNGFIRWVEQLPFASIDNVWLYKLEVVGIYLFLLLAFYYFSTRRSRELLLCLACLLAVSVYGVVQRWQDRPQRSLVFYNVRGCPAVHCLENDGRSWLNYGDSLPNKKRLHRVAGNFWKRHQLDEPVEVTSDYREAGFSIRQQIVSFHGRRVCMVTDNRWRNQWAASPLPVHYLYICKGYSGRLEELVSLFPAACVILDSSLAEHRRLSFERACRELRIDLISLPQEGSVGFLL